MKPATPLPWNGLNVWMRNGNSGDPQDARYIAHAANAYPKLIQALRLENVSADGGQRMNTPIAVLLRELGELGEDA